MRKFSIYFITILVLSLGIFSQQPVEKPAWKVELPQNKTARSTLTVQNRCKKSHNFQIQPQNVPFLEFGKTRVKVKGGKNSVVPVLFNTTNLAAKNYQGQVLVICLDCAKEPTCTQDKEVLPVFLTVTALVNANSQENLCQNLRNNCYQLLAVWKNKASIAADFQTTANAEKSKSDKAKDEADKAEEDARIAEEAAADEESTYRAKINDKEYHSNDIAYMKVMQAENLAAYQSGTISVDEYQRRAKEITPTKAREERLKNKERLKKEAKKAREKAQTKSKVADDAKKIADEAQLKANSAKSDADSARKAYEDCLKKVKEECEKIKAEQAKAEAERKKREEAEREAKEEEERLQAEEEKRKENEARNVRKRKENREYLVDNIKKLGLIDSRAMSKVPGIWEWLPDILETPVSMLAEQQTGVPIPTDTIKALGGLYGIVGKLLDPCSKAGKEKTITRLQTMINPKTKKNYTWDQALKKTDDMCKLLGDLRGKLRELEKAEKK